MQHENVEPLKTEPGFGHRAPTRQMNGGEWCENGAATGKLRRSNAHEMRHGAPKWRARRDRRVRDGGKAFWRDFMAVCQKNKSREPSVGDAERVSAQVPPFGQFLAGSALYFHAAESGRRCDQMPLSIHDLCPCAIQSRPFGLPYVLFFTTQGAESRRSGSCVSSRSDRSGKIPHVGRAVEFFVWAYRWASNSQRWRWARNARALAFTVNAAPPFKLLLKQQAQNR